MKFDRIRFIANRSKKKKKNRDLSVELIKPHTLVSWEKNVQNLTLIKMHFVLFKHLSQNNGIKALS